MKTKRGRYSRDSSRTTSTITDYFQSRQKKDESNVENITSSIHLPDIVQSSLRTSRSSVSSILSRSPSRTAEQHDSAEESSQLPVTPSKTKISSKSSSREPSPRRSASRSTARTSSPSPSCVSSVSVASKTNAIPDAAKNDSTTTRKTRRRCDSDEYVVERIRGMRFAEGSRTREFRIHWKSYASDDDTWEPEENLNCYDLIRQFVRDKQRERDGRRHAVSSRRPTKKRAASESESSGDENEKTRERDLLWNSEPIARHRASTESLKSEPHI